MSDLRFKITGSASPFVANIYREDGTTGGTYVTSQIVEYSGVCTTNQCNNTCVIFGGLVANTSYRVKITDCVGNSCDCWYGTPPDPIPIPIVRNIELCGDIYTPPVDGVCITCGCKEIIFTPPLSGTECVNVNLCAISCNSVGDTANILVYKKSGTAGSFVEIGNITNNNTIINTNLGANDRLCYDLYTETDNSPGLSYACSELSLSCASPISGISTITCGPQTCIDISNTCCTTTTTTSTTSTPISVYFTNVNQSAMYCDVVVSAGLATSPPLQAGQSFRVTMYLKSYYNVTNGLVTEMNTQAKSECNGSINRQTSLSTGLPTGSATDVSTSSIYYDVNSTNIDDLCFCVCANDDVNNNSLPHQLYSCICICAIENQVGGTYNKGTTGKITACTIGA